jgi:hypothetical protein
MNKDFLVYKIITISEQLTTEQIMFSRKKRNWKKFDKLSEVEKLIIRLEELQYYEDIIDPNYEPKSYKSNF